MILHQDAMYINRTAKNAPLSLKRYQHFLYKLLQLTHMFLRLKSILPSYVSLNKLSNGIIQAVKSISRNIMYVTKKNNTCLFVFQSEMEKWIFSRNDHTCNENIMEEIFIHVAHSTHKFEDRKGKNDTIRFFGDQCKQQNKQSLFKQLRDSEDTSFVLSILFSLLIAIQFSNRR